MRGWDGAFVVRLRAEAPGLAEALASRVQEGLRTRAAGGTVQADASPAGAIGTVAVVGVRDPRGFPRWLAPLPLPQDPDMAAREVLAYLERWGFIPRAAAPQRVA